jgi:hypothetical protein
MHRETLPRGYRRWEKAGLAILRRGDLIDGAFSLYRAGAPELLRAIIIPATITFAVLSLWFQFVPQKLFTAPEGTSVLRQALDVFGWIVIGLIFGVPLVFLTYAYMTGVVALFTAQRYLGNDVDPLWIRRVAWTKLPLLVLSNVALFFVTFGVMLVSLLLLLASALLSEASQGGDPSAPIISFLGLIGVIAGFLALPLVYSSYCLAPIIVVLERCGVRKALQRSNSLMGSLIDPPRTTALGLVLLCLFLQFLLYESFSLPIGLAMDHLTTLNVLPSSLFVRSLRDLLPLLAGALSFIVVQPILLCGLTLLYYDVRIRYEGLDIQLLAQQIWRRARAVDFDL